MKTVIFILFLFTSLTAGAQFAPIGAQWTYNNRGGVQYHNYPNAIFSVIDTSVNGTACRRVIGDCTCGTSTSNFIYESGSKVYWYNFALNDFTLLYDFNLNVGETWTVLANYTTADSITLRVDSIHYDTINGNVRRVQAVSTVATFGNAYIFSGPVIEGIGSMFCLYPQSASCDPPTFGLRCYQDSVIGLFDTHLAPTCEEEFIDSGIGINEISTTISATISPNPFHDEATLTLHENNSADGILELADVTGRIIREEKFSGNKILIDKKNLEDGIYFYRLKTNMATASGKFIVQ